jgi:hypothetical protein
MSAARVSKSQPQGPAFQKATPASKATSKATSKPQGASGMGSQGWKVPTFTPKGEKGQCMALVNSGHQCSNPANYPTKVGTLCSGHFKRHQQGATIRTTSKVVAYPAHLWGTPQQGAHPTSPQGRASKATPKGTSQKATSKARKATSTPQASTVAPSATPEPLTVPEAS